MTKKLIQRTDLVEIITNVETGTIGLKFHKRMIEQDTVTLTETVKAEGYHRGVLMPGDDIDAYLALVDANLVRDLGEKPTSAAAKASIASAVVLAATLVGKK